MKWVKTNGCQMARLLLFFMVIIEANAWNFLSAFASATSFIGQEKKTPWKLYTWYINQGQWSWVCTQYLFGPQVKKCRFWHLIFGHQFWTASIATVSLKYAGISQNMYVSCSKNVYCVRANRMHLLIRMPGDTFWVHYGHFQRKLTSARPKNLKN